MAAWKTLFDRLRGSRTSSEPLDVVLYTRADCPLCDEMRHALAAARTRVPWKLTVLDIDSDPDLRARYDRSVPVLAIGGRPAFKGRMSPAEFTAKLERRAREAARQDA